jgi:diguanylate cyclase (GGDEF)-like protein
MNFGLKYTAGAKALAPVIVGALVVGALVLTLLLWLTSEIDRAAQNRQERLAALIVSQMESSLAHDQEGSTVWDDAVQKVKEGDQYWMDQNLGSWMHSYFGHDGAIVLDAAGKPIYAFLDDKIVEPKIYQTLASEIDPLVHDLRARLKTGDDSGTSERVLSPGAADLAIVAGRPAVVSVKPIVSDTGNIVQTPGEEYVQIAIRFLDGQLVAELQHKYQFDGLRFSWRHERQDSEAAFPLLTKKGQTLGYFLWQPFRPGAAFLDKLLPALAIVFFTLVAIIGVMVLRLRRRALNLRLSEAAIRHLAHHDSLTDLPNRTLFNLHVERVLATPEARAAVLYLDLDRFKQVNDTLGHPAGDELIRQFGSRLVALVDPSYTVARLGGDEFMILVPHVDNEAEIEQLGQALIASARTPFDIHGNQIFVGVSVGAAMTPHDGTERVELTRKADVALYHAKMSGRSCYARFSEEMDVMLHKRRRIEQDLRAALARPEDGQLRVHYQPVYASRGGAITGFEALLRWQHPTLGMITPETFIHIAEEAGLIERLGQNVLREACLAAIAWPGLSVAVNISAIELRNPALPVRVAETLMETGLLPSRLELEITESALTDPSGSCEDNVRALRGMGVRIALDDFGTGFSSLTRLQQLTVDRIKIDRNFVHGFGKAGSDEAIVQAIVDLARATGLKTTAEGVETDDQKSFLRHIGCDELQGFGFSRPMPREEANRLVLGAEAAPAMAQAAG